jgi:hypothetical protein
MKLRSCKIFLLALIIHSCHINNAKSDSSEINLSGNLEVSTRVISEQSKHLFHTLEIDLLKQNPNQQSDYLFSKAEANYSISKSLHESITDLQSKFPISESGSEINELYNNLSLFKENLLNIDSEFSAANAKEVLGLVTLDNPKIKTKNDFVSLLSRSNEQGFKLILCKIHNSVSILENKMLTHFNIASSGTIKVKFDRFVSLVSQNCKRLSRGDTLEISAGVGVFSNASNPHITINGSNIKVGSNGVAKYSFKVNGEDGMNVVPVYIEFTSFDGIKQNSKVPVIYYIDK